LKINNTFTKGSRKKIKKIQTNKNQIGKKNKIRQIRIEELNWKKKPLCKGVKKIRNKKNKDLIFLWGERK
jgi:hypothetical protein